VSIGPALPGVKCRVIDPGTGADLGTGRHLTVTDDLDRLLARVDEIKHEDLYALRLRTGRVA
jgi:hypothetical protein